LGWFVDHWSRFVNHRRRWRWKRDLFYIGFRFGIGFPVGLFFFLLLVLGLRWRGSRCTAQVIKRGK